MLTRRKFLSNAAKLSALSVVPVIPISLSKKKLSLVERMEKGEIIIWETFTIDKTITIPNTSFIMYGCYVHLLNDAYIYVPRHVTKARIMYCTFQGSYPVPELCHALMHRIRQPSNTGNLFCNSNKSSSSATTMPNTHKRLWWFCQLNYKHFINCKM